MEEDVMCWKKINPHRPHLSSSYFHSLYVRGSQNFTGHLSPNEGPPGQGLPILAGVWNDPGSFPTPLPSPQAQRFSCKCCRGGWGSQSPEACRVIPTSPPTPGTQKRYPRAPGDTQTPQQTSLKLVVQKNPLQGLLKRRLLAPNAQ